MAPHIVLERRAQAGLSLPHTLRHWPHGDGLRQKRRGGEMTEKQTLGRKWSRLFAEALEFDSWGQIEEAQETYTR